MVLDLKGKIIVGEACGILRETLQYVTHRGQKKILLNMSGVQYVDSSGLGALVGASTVFAAEQGQLKLLNLTRFVYDLFRVTKLLGIFEIYNDEATAIKSFS